MADDRMKNADQEKNLGKDSQHGEFGGGQHAPGRNPKDDRSTQGGKEKEPQRQDDDMSKQGDRGASNR
jgi:hypothetical protein